MAGYGRHLVRRVIRVIYGMHCSFHCFHPLLVFLANILGNSLFRRKVWVEFGDGAIDERDVLAAQGWEEVVNGDMVDRRV